MTPEEATARTLARVNGIKGPADCCWLWTGATRNGGYGFQSHKAGGKVIVLYAHKVAWEETNGPVPDGYRVYHLCPNKHCVNPEHLTLATNTGPRPAQTISGHTTKQLEANAARAAKLKARSEKLKAEAAAVLATYHPEQRAQLENPKSKRELRAMAAAETSETSAT